MAIKAVIFDLGGVIINIDYALTIQQFTDFGCANFKEIYTQHKQTTLFDQYETGKITDTLFRKELLSLLGLSLSDEQFDNAWNAMLLDIPQARLNYIRQIKHKGYKTILFSNINNIHFKKFLTILEQSGYLTCFADLFDKEYYSHICNFRKPHEVSFLNILHDLGLKPHEVLFIDDSIQHINGAKAVGIHAELIDNKNTSLFDVEKMIAAKQESLMV